MYIFSHQRKEKCSKFTSLSHSPAVPKLLKETGTDSAKSQSSAQVFPQGLLQFAHSLSPFSVTPNGKQYLPQVCLIHSGGTAEKIFLKEQRTFCSSRQDGHVFQQGQTLLFASQRHHQLKKWAAAETALHISNSPLALQIRTHPSTPRQQSISQLQIALPTKLNLKIITE